MHGAHEDLVAQALEQIHKTGTVEGLRGTFAMTQPQAGQLPVGEVKAVHGQVLAAVAKVALQSLGQCGLAGAVRSEEAEQRALRD